MTPVRVIRGIDVAGRPTLVHLLPCASGTLKRMKSGWLNERLTLRVGSWGHVFAHAIERNYAAVAREHLGYNHAR